MPDKIENEDSYRLYWHEGDFIRIVHKDNYALVKINDFYNHCMPPKNPFERLTLPKVMVYSSSLMNIEELLVGFAIIEYNPRIIDGQDVSGYIPWTHVFVFYDYNNHSILELTLMVSSEQLRSEFAHDFSVPKIDSCYLSVSPWMSKIFDYKQPVFRYEAIEELHRDEFLNIPTGRNQFKQVIELMRNYMLMTLIDNVTLEVEVTKDSEQFAENMYSFLGKDKISITHIDETVQNLGSNSTSGFFESFQSYVSNLTWAENAELQEESPF